MPSPTFKRSLSALGLSTLFVCGSVSAATVPFTFAQFRQTEGDNGFVYKDVSVNYATFTSIDGGVPVTFEFLNIDGLAPELQGPQQAHLYLYAVGSAAISNTGLVAQSLESDSASPTGYGISIVRDTPAPEGTGDKTHLLNVQFSGVLAGFEGSTSLTYLSPPDSLGAGQGSAAYSSDFLVFQPLVGAGNMSLSFTSAKPAVSYDSNNLVFNDFTASGTGTFDLITGDATVPEPAMLSLLAFGGLILLRRPSDEE